MTFVKTSFIPQDNISLCIVDERITQDMIDNLENKKIKLIKNKCIRDTYSAISGHPDISLIKLNNNNILVSPNIYDNYKYLMNSYNINVIKGDSTITDKYPHNVQYNVAILGKYAIHNFKYTDKVLLKYLKDNDFTLINVKQGYCKCSICIVDENSIITSDEGIYKEVIKYNIDCLLINKGHIDLFDLNYGFIGGCSGLISPKCLAFFGDISKHPNFKEIKDFLYKKGLTFFSLSNEKLLDLGSLIPLA